MPEFSVRLNSDSIALKRLSSALACEANCRLGQTAVRQLRPNRIADGIRSKLRYA